MKKKKKNSDSYASSRRRSGDLAMEDPSSHIVVSIQHYLIRMAQIEEKLRRIFMKDDEESNG